MSLRGLMVAASASEIPIVDYGLAATDKAAFLRQLHQALATVGIIAFINVPGFDAEVQQQRFASFRQFFALPPEVKASASIALTPHFRGLAGPVQSPSQLVETYQYGIEAAAQFHHDDASVPAWQRILFGPNTWPDEASAPSFRTAVEELRAAYLALHHALGHLICEALGAEPWRYDEFFDAANPMLAAFVGHSYSLSHIERGGLALNSGAVSGTAGRQRVIEEAQKWNGHGTHIDVPPFTTLLTMDRPGLQVLAQSGDGPVWVDVPVIPGGVCVQVGSALQHLSSGRFIATTHRVNTMLIPDGDTRVSCPFFLLPQFETPLKPFDGTPAEGYANEDRGEGAAHNRMTLFPTCTKRWWTAEFERTKDRARKRDARENKIAVEKVIARGRSSNERQSAL